MYEPPKSMKPMGKKTREWKFHDWELLGRKGKGHDEVVNRLKEFIEKRYSVKVSRDFRKQEREQLWIAFNEQSKRHHVIFRPDLIVRYGDRMFIEYVNSQGKNSENFSRDLRGMIALECTMKQRGLKAEYFILVLRESLGTYLLNRPIYAKYELDIMPLSILLRHIERGRLFSFYRNKASNEQMTPHAF
jgi:hypothetical protein